MAGFRTRASMKVYYALALTTLVVLAPMVEARQIRNAKAANLAKMLQPGQMDQSTDASHLTGVVTRLIAVLNALEQSSRGAGPPPKDLLKRAYAMRNDVDDKYAELARSAIYDAWREAHSLGLFNSDEVFGRTISDGIDGGISRDHADVFGPEGATERKEFFVRQCLDRHRVIRNPLLTPGLVMQRQRHQRFSRARGGIENDIVSCKQLQNGFFLVIVEIDF